MPHSQGLSLKSIIAITIIIHENIFRGDLGNDSTVLLGKPDYLENYVSIATPIAVLFNYKALLLNNVHPALPLSLVAPH